MILSRCERAQGRGVCCIAASIGTEFFAKPAYIFWLMVHNGKHAAEEEQVARLQGLNVTAKGSGRGWQVNAKFLHSSLGAAWMRILTDYHRPKCAPPSTCSTSPVT